MIQLNLIRLIFIVCSVLLTLLLIHFCILMLKKKNEYSLPIFFSILAAIYSISMYSIFLLVKTHRAAVFWDSMFFIGTDWMTYCMLIFSIVYTNKKSKFNKLFYSIVGSLVIADTLSLVINNFTFHSFDLVLLQSLNRYYYWGNNFKFIHYCHLFFCYAMVGITFINLFIASVKAPKIYKTKYSGLLIAYLVVIIVNFVCYTINIPIDFSVILYPILAAFISYYATYTYPKSILNQSLCSVNETINDGILYFDIEGVCIYANKPAKKAFSTRSNFNLTAAEVYRKKIADMLDAEEYYLKLNDDFVIDADLFNYEIEFRREFYNGYEIGSLLRLIDKTEEITNYRKEVYNATHDELTGILNRVGFFEKVDESVARNGASNHIMLVSNIKDFKLINELFGEKLGDEILLKQSSLLHQFSHKENIYGRVSDDKFALYTKKEFFEEEKFIHYITAMQRLTERSLYKMHVFVGVYEPKGHYEKCQSMYDKALMALAEKSDNYNEIFSYYDSNLMDRLLSEKNIASDFALDLEKGKIKMYLQPIIDEKNGKFGAEALCRWQHSIKGLMLPNEFLPILEKSGLIYMLDEYIWNQAAKKIHEWKLKGLIDCYISVNVSVKDFFYTDIYKTFTHLIEKYDIDPKSLHIEITESLLMTDFEKANILSTKLRKFGFCVSVDNFGNGYSSLNMLKDFRAEVLKIDMAFIKEAENPTRSQIILESIISMAHSLQMEVVGEGVEEQNQYDLLRKFDCKVFQGNYLSPPITVEEFENKYIQYFVK